MQLTLSVGLIVSLVILFLFARYGRAADIYGDFGRFAVLIIGIWGVPKLAGWIVDNFGQWIVRNLRSFKINVDTPDVTAPILQLIFFAILVFLTYKVFFIGKPLPGSKPPSMTARVLSMLIATANGVIICAFIFDSIMSIGKISNNNMTLPSLPSTDIRIDNQFQFPFANWPRDLVLLLAGAVLVFMLLAAPSTIVSTINRKVERPRIGVMFLGIIAAIVIMLIWVDAFSKR